MSLLKILSMQSTPSFDIGKLLSLVQYTEKNCVLLFMISKATAVSYMSRLHVLVSRIQAILNKNEIPFDKHPGNILIEKQEIKRSRNS